ncbi:MAG TPA: hypothetical protein HPP76_10475 [Desulfuromonadales bacterium]|nr:hypothetical protein [Desulfuromonadales bacterium]
MRYRLFTTLMFLCISASHAAADNSVTLFRDGTLIERDATATKGIIDLPLPAGVLEGSLRVIPATGIDILTVDVVPSQSSGKGSQELDALVEQKQRLEDRLQALTTREQIFTSAAKSQSGKAPRKSKSNPDPLQTIRQGTDFAIAQLEAVYTARRKTDHELKRVVARIAELRRKNRTDESRAHISIAQQKGKVTVRYATTDVGWQPRYNLYLTGSDSARLNLSARTEAQPAGNLVRVSAASIRDGGGQPTVSVSSDNRARLADYQLAFSETGFDDSVAPRLTGRLTNHGKLYIPAGESGLYRNGVYLGRFAFSGLSSGKSTAISLGK